MTYEGIYRTCRFVVTVSNRGQSLYENLKIDLERCLGGLAGDLKQEVSNATQWMALFVQICRWFEAQVVRQKSITRGAHITDPWPVPPQIPFDIPRPIVYYTRRETTQCQVSYNFAYGAYGFHINHAAISPTRSFLTESSKVHK